jgi:tetratricopeptide (TPR) repeat protein
MRKPLALTVVALAVALIAGFLRVQPRGVATVFRTGDELTFRDAPVYFRPAISESRCRVTTISGTPAFEDNLIARSSTYDEFPLRVRLTYQVPPSLPAGWPRGDWCSSLHSRVAAAVGRWSITTTADELLDGRRSAGDRAAAAIDEDLRTANVKAASVSARIDLPDHFARLRTVPEAAARARRAGPVIFVGLDGADWELLDGYLSAGAMPNLRRLVNTGAGGVLETELPPLSPIVWTTMMTGVSPLKHEILDFTRFNPTTHEKEPITSDERRAPAIWNMLTAAGKSVAVFGLWATYAAEPVHGINVSDRLFTFLYSEHERPPAAVYPATRESWAGDAVRGAEEAISAARMRTFLPSMTDAEYAALSRNTNPYSEPAAALRRILLETEIYRRLATDVLNGQRIPDVTIAYFQGTDSVGHVFAPFAPPRQPSVSEADYERYHDVPAHYFRDIDTLLGEFMALSEQRGATLMIASDHGFHWREGRPANISSTATATAAKWHRREGIYLLWGRGIAAVPNHPLRGAVRQVCATLLSLSGAPAALNGTAPLPGAPAAGASVDYAQWFTPAPPPPATAAPGGSAEEIAKLRALGYIGSGESTRSAVPQSTTHTAGWSNNAGLILREEHRLDDAIAAFDRALEIDPQYASAMWNLSETFFEAKRELDRSDALLVAATNKGLSDGVKFVIGRAIQYQRDHSEDRATRLIDSAIAANATDGELRMFRGRLRMDRHDCSAALEDFLAATQTRPNDALAFASAGLAQMCLGDARAARESFNHSLMIDPNQPILRQAIAQLP